MGGFHVLISGNSTCSRLRSSAAPRLRLRSLRNRKGSMIDGLFGLLQLRPWQGWGHGAHRGLTRGNGSFQTDPHWEFWRILANHCAAVQGHGGSANGEWGVRNPDAQWETVGREWMRLDATSALTCGTTRLLQGHGGSWSESGDAQALFVKRPDLP